MNLSVEQIMDKIQAEPLDNQEAMADKLMKEYKGEDKDLVEPWIYEMIDTNLAEAGTIE